MSHDSKKEFIELLDLMKHSLKKQELHQVIRDFKKSAKSVNSDLGIPKSSVIEMDCMLKIVSVSYQIPIATILTTNRRGDYYAAKRMSFCLLHDCLGFTAQEIAEIFCRKVQQVQFELTSFSKLDKKNKVDSIFLNRFEAVKQDFLNTNK